MHDSSPTNYGDEATSSPKPYEATYDVSQSSLFKKIFLLAQEKIILLEDNLGGLLDPKSI
jgi:hypothetical protein